MKRTVRVNFDIAVECGHGVSGLSDDFPFIPDDIWDEEERENNE